jgi:alpha-mannosidase
MTSSKKYRPDEDPQQDQHSHPHDHSHLHNQQRHSHNHPHAHLHPLPPKAGISRRGFFKAVLAGLAGVFLPGWMRSSEGSIWDGGAAGGGSQAGPTANPAPAVSEAAKRIYLAPDDHSDYVWTADEATYANAFVEMLDYYLGQADATAGNPSSQRARWNCDGWLWMWTYEQRRTPTQFSTLINRIKDGTISVPLNPLCVVLGGTPAEAVLRMMYYPGTIERRFNVRFPLAYAMENQTLPYGLGALWAGSGAKYSWKGVCACATLVSELNNRDHEIYWWTGPDGSRILMKWNSLLAGTNMSLGGYAEARFTSSVVDYVDTDSGFFAKYMYPVIGVFGKGWDDLKTLTTDFVVAAQTKSNVDRQVIVSNEQDFFADFETAHGSVIASQAVSFGNEWELLEATLAEPSARLKRSVEKLRPAEAMAALARLYGANPLNGLTAARDTAWQSLGKYFEHCWTADGPVGKTARETWSKGLINPIESYSDSLYNAGVSALGSLIAKSGTNQRFFVFNPLSWARQDWADLPYAGTIPNPFKVTEVGTGVEVPAQTATVDGRTYVRIWASLPSVGYRVYEVAATAPQTFGGGPTANAATRIIENSQVQATVDARGAITSLLDKSQANREMIQGAANLFTNAAGGTISVEDAGPVTATLRIVIPASGGRLAQTTRITLGRGGNRVDIRNDISQNFGDTRTWSFGFALAAAQTYHEEVGAILLAKRKAAGGDYANRNARYDWLTLNRFADMTGSGPAGVTLSNRDCYFMQLGNSSVGTLDSAATTIKVLAGGQVCIPGDTGIGLLNQGGATSFQQRFALRPHAAYDPAAALRFALEHQTPPVCGAVTGGSALPADSFSLFTISSTDTLLTALKPPEDSLPAGQVVVRLWNLAAAGRASRITSPSTTIQAAKRITHIETDIAAMTLVNGGVEDNLTAQQMKSYMLTLQTGAIPPQTPRGYAPMVRR